MSIRALVSELHRWQWIGIFAARLAVGLLFLVSGQGKLFVSERRRQMRATLESAHIPFPGVNSWFVSGVEFVFGLLLVFGALTQLACVMLAGVMAVALASKIREIKVSSLLDWLGQFLYFPEALYLVILFWLFLSGPGWYSVDYILFSPAGF
jgi:putative oxidoreductase